MFGVIPQDCLWNIGKFLDVKNILKLCEVSNLFYDIFSNNEFWKILKPQILIKEKITTAMFTVLNLLLSFDSNTSQKSIKLNIKNVITIKRELINKKGIILNNYSKMITCSISYIGCPYDTFDIDKIYPINWCNSFPQDCMCRYPQYIIENILNEDSNGYIFRRNCIPFISFRSLNDFCKFLEIKNYDQFKKELHKKLFDTKIKEDLKFEALFQVIIECKECLSRIHNALPYAIRDNFMKTFIYTELFGNFYEELLNYYYRNNENYPFGFFFNGWCNLITKINQNYSNIRRSELKQHKKNCIIS